MDMKVDAHGTVIQNEKVTEIYINEDLSLHREVKDYLTTLFIEGDEFTLDHTDLTLLLAGLETALSNGWGLPSVRGVKND